MDFTSRVFVCICVRNATSPTIARASFPILEMTQRPWVFMRSELHTVYENKRRRAGSTLSVGATGIKRNVSKFKQIKREEEHATGTNTLVHSAGSTSPRTLGAIEQNC